MTDYTLHINTNLRVHENQFDFDFVTNLESENPYPISIRFRTELVIF